MSRYYISDVTCVQCKQSIARNWVYRGRLELLCPNCGTTFRWPYRIDIKEFKCQRCGQDPDFVTGDDKHGANNPILLCKECVAKIAINDLRMATSATPRSLYIVIGSFLLGTSVILAVFGLIVGGSGSLDSLIVSMLAAEALVGVALIVMSKNLAERSSKRAQTAHDILQRIDADTITIEQKLAVFGLVPGGILPQEMFNRLSGGFAEAALKRAQAQ